MARDRLARRADDGGYANFRARRMIFAGASPRAHRVNRSTPPASKQGKNVPLLALPKPSPTRPIDCVIPGSWQRMEKAIAVDAPTSPSRPRTLRTHPHSTTAGQAILPAPARRRSADRRRKTAEPNPARTAPVSQAEKGGSSAVTIRLLSSTLRQPAEGRSKSSVCSARTEGSRR